MTNTDIRDVILKTLRSMGTHLNDLVGVTVKHPKYGRGRISEFSDLSHRVTVEFDDTAKTLHRDLHDLIGPDSSCKVSTKQLERKFGHLRSALQTAPKLIGLFPWRVTTSHPNPSTPFKPEAKLQAKKLARSGPPPGMKPLFIITKH